MAKKSITVEVEAIGHTLVNVIKNSLDKAFDKAFKEIAVKKKEVTDAESTDIQGMREQIKANCNLLIPVMKAAKTKAYHLTSNFDLEPEVHIVTLGNDPKIRPIIFKGNVALCEKFLEADPASTTAGALANLLSLTETLLEVHISKIGVDGVVMESKLERERARAACEAMRERVVSTRFDHAAWDGDQVANPVFHANAGFTWMHRHGSPDSGYGSSGAGSFTSVPPPAAMHDAGLDAFDRSYFGRQ